MSLAPIDQIPDTGDDDVRFVVHLDPDPRPFLMLENMRLRRRGDRLTVEFPYGEAWINIHLQDTEPGTWTMASLGPLLDPFWDAYAHSGTSFFAPADMVRCPLLMSALMHKSVSGQFGDLTVSVAILAPAPPGVTVSLAVVGVEGHVFQGIDVPFINAGLCSARVAIDILLELASLNQGALGPSLTTTQWIETIGKGADTAGKVLDVLSKVSKLLGS